MDYETFLSLIKEEKIEKATFHLRGYGHYAHCALTYTKGKDDVPNPFYPILCFDLTKDGKECRIFHRRFNSAEKMFYFKGKGRKTLQEVWNDLEFDEITYFVS